MLHTAVTVVVAGDDVAADAAGCCYVYVRLQQLVPATVRISVVAVIVVVTLP